MKKQFLFFSMLLMGLFAAGTAAHADEKPFVPKTDAYWAILTAHPASSTGGTGLVFVDTARIARTSAAFAAVSTDSAYSKTYAMTTVNKDKPYFKSVYAQSADGSYFAGWSYTDGGSELNTEYIESDGIDDLAPSLEPGVANARKYDIYAAFKPIRLASYSIDRSDEFAQEIKIIAEADKAKSIGFGDGNAARHFKLPVITKKDGTLGTWETNVTEWISTVNLIAGGGTAELTIVVTLTTPDDDPREYAATLTMETKAGIKLEIPLYARIKESAARQAIRYDKNKVEKESGTFVDLLAHAETDDIIKLRGSLSGSSVPDQVIDKNITIDLNGYNFQKALTINGGNVTIAYSPYGGKITKAVTVASGKLTANGGEFMEVLTVNSGAEAVLNGATTDVLVTNNGTLTVTDGELLNGVTSAGTLNINGGKVLNESGAAITITAGTASINRGIITGSTYGVEVTGGAAAIEKLAAVSGDTKAVNRTNGSLTVNNGKFTDPSKLADGTITFNAGFFKTNAGGATDVLGKSIFRNTAGTEFREGYTLFAGTAETAQKSGVSVCRINETSYAKLEDAIAYANNHPGAPIIIFMENDYTLPAGNYTIPANTTLVVPMSDDQDGVHLTVEHKSVSSSENYITPYPFRTLTFADGVNMEILGALEVTCVEACKASAAMQSVPDGPYGRLILQGGSHITLSAGSELRAWGYIIGEGVIDARRGAIVREQFQIGDWKGGDISLTMIMEDSIPERNLHLFPVYSYFIQNIESPVKYHPGAKLLCAVAIEVSGIRAYADEIEVVGVQGDPAMFLMDQKADAENTWVRKSYDAARDYQVYDVNSGAQLGSIVINLGKIRAAIIPGQQGNPDIWSITMDSRKFILPLTSNFKIHLLSGQMEFTQSTACLPGTEVEVDKESTISIVHNSEPGVVDGALYLYDTEQWGRFVHATGSTKEQKNQFGTIVNYSATVGHKPDVRNISSAAELGDAKLIVHGTFQMAAGCAVYTTAGQKLKSSGGDEYVYEVDLDAPGGASITSTNIDAGTFVFKADAVKSQPLTVTKSGTKLTSIGDEEGHITEDVLINFDGYSGNAWNVKTVLGHNSDIYNYQLCTSARLKNSDESFVNTYTDDEHYALANDAYCFIDDRWRILKVDENNECFMADMADPYHPQYYAKPQEYVAITATKDGEGNFIGNDDHTFSDAAGSGRLFILISEPDCQWWEVVNENNLYHCIHPQNDTYYYWDESDEMWKEKRFVISWLNYNGDTLVTADEHGNPTKSYSVTYGTQAEYFGSTPTRPATIDYTYDFVGWSPVLAPVTKDVSYTAVYDQKERKYTVIFQNEGGTEIERQLLGHNEVPVCENVPTRVGFTLQWSPAIAAVTGDAVYSATWLPEPPTEYEITFVDYDGDVVNHTIWKGNVAVGTLPAAPAISDGKPVGAAGKPATSEFSYVFDHWSPNVTEVTQAMTYVAVYREEPIQYTVTFQNEDGSEIEHHSYAYGAMPVCENLPSKPNTEEWSYELIWTPNIKTVMGNATYRADFETLKTKRRYTVAAQCSPAGAATMTGNGVYEYNAATDAVTLGFTAADGFYFTKWSDDVYTPTRTMPVTGNITLTAIFSNEAPVNYTITWKNEDGSATLQTVTQPAGPTSYTGDTPTKPATSSATYEFDGWTTEPNGAGDYYKNGMTPEASADATYYAHFKVVANPDIEIGVGQIRTLTEETTCEDLIITSDGVNSGQLAGAGFLTLTGHAHFDYAINAEGGLWYQVAVPWQVALEDGISVNGQKKTINSDCLVLTYDGETRAQTGINKSWIHLTSSDVMQPGLLYMIWLSHDAPIIRFTKKDGESILNTTTSVTTHWSDNVLDRNWNGVANPAVFYAYVDAGVTEGQTYVPASDSYTLFEMDQILSVARGAYVQATSKDITVHTAPRRWAATSNALDSKYEVRLAPINKSFTDRIIVKANDSKQEDVYVIGKDLAKLGVSAKIPQLWVNRYNTTLCVNTMTPVEGNAEYPLGIYVPETGEYTLSIKYGALSDTQSDLYLTLDGQAIWNLSRNAYTVELEKGNTERYGLRLSAKAPQATQAIDEIIVNSKDDTATKVLMDGQVFIIRGGEVYTVTGNKVK